ncbi:MAG: hypothetical protein K9N47_11680 [Prosthecobacter sp.]|uniref:hypothetical protein n=1 Tax=Prosthecobacter sp. TaxID=1965333 RepID=UPI0025F04AAC|nr:hypothetical protein [Prosthecobacter sp.]MCF7786775.1 hypothetical protein [Prosthecobacter sp.]
MSRIDNPPIATWFSQVVADQRRAHFMVFWHHYDAGSYTHTSNHGIFFDLNDSIDYAVALIRRVRIESRTPLTQEDIEGYEEHMDFSDLTMDWGSRDLDIVDKSGEVLFHQVSHWQVSPANLTATLDFDLTTADQIRHCIQLDEQRQSSSAPQPPSASANPQPGASPQPGLTIGQAHGGLLKNLIEQHNLVARQVLTQEEAEKLLKHSVHQPKPDSLVQLLERVVAATRTPARQE